MKLIKILKKKSAASIKWQRSTDRLFQCHSSRLSAERLHFLWNIVLQPWEQQNVLHRSPINVLVGSIFRCNQRRKKSSRCLLFGWNVQGWPDKKQQPHDTLNRAGRKENSIGSGKVGKMPLTTDPYSGAHSTRTSTVDKQPNLVRMPLIRIQRPAYRSK